MGGTSTCWVRQLFLSSIGKKSVMAVTGLVLFGFVVGHLVGNLQVFIPDDGKKLNAYAAFLKANAGVLWGARIVLLAALLAHVGIAILLALENRGARPVAYRVKTYREASYAARTMIISGPLILLYVVYHLLHFTWGTVHPSFNHDDVYHNVITGFQQPAASAVYIVAMALLGLHLFHGLWSMCQSLGVNHPKYNALLRAGSAAVASAITIGYIAIPVAVMAKLLK
ncbi:MAG: succinate dehydrogenase cytochrome b subunit [Planctomycetes bacterium]|nr:succinate dehydrogenase cytochrome b subunit [Planctomycetota bacterium]